MNCSEHNGDMPAELKKDIVQRWIRIINDEQEHIFKECKAKNVCFDHFVEMIMTYLINVAIKNIKKLSDGDIGMQNNLCGSFLIEVAKGLSMPIIVDKDETILEVNDSVH